MMWNLVAGNSNFTVNADIEIFEKYRPAGILQGEELLLRHSDALQFIADCEGLGLTILGMNFFEQQGNKIIELLCPADYSSLSLEVNITVAETAMGKPLSKASNGGLSDVLRESLDFTRGEFQVGLEP